MTTRQNFNLIAGIAFLVGAVALVAQGQAVGGAGAQETSRSLLDYWRVGGFAMYPIGLCSVALVGFSIYCAILYKTSKMTQPQLVPLLGEALEALDIEKAKSICSSAPGVLTNVLSAGLGRIRPDAEINIPEVEKAMEEASVEEVATGMKPLGYLSIITQVAPMFGLLGTVTGMIGAFDKIGMGQMGSPEKLADNIGEAMITTAAGLIVAIPAMFAYFGFKAHYTANISRISSLLGDLTFHLKEGVRQNKVDEGKVF